MSTCEHEIIPSPSEMHLIQFLLFFDAIQIIHFKPDQGTCEPTHGLKPTEGLLQF